MWRKKSPLTSSGFDCVITWNCSVLQFKQAVLHSVLSFTRVLSDSGWYCIVWSYIALCSIVLHLIVLHLIVLHCIVQHCAELQGTAIYHAPITYWQEQINICLYLWPLCCRVMWRTFGSKWFTLQGCQLTFCGPIEKSLKSVDPFHLWCKSTCF